MDICIYIYYIYNIYMDIWCNCAIQMRQAVVFEPGRFLPSRLYGQASRDSSVIFGAISIAPV
jgi:hypothetical protein